MPVATSTAIALGIGGAAAGFGASKLMQPKQRAMSPIPLPQPPSQEVSQTKAIENIQRRKASATQTVYTSPLGASGQADVAKKFLLGQ